MLNMEGFSLIAVSAIFSVAAGIVWFAGSRLSRYTDALAEQTGIAEVLLGSLLLGGVTSLPEVVTTITASAGDNAGIAVNNLFGGVALQVTTLAVGDAFLKGKSISSTIGSAAVKLQAIVGIVLMATAAAVAMVGDVRVAHMGIGSALIFSQFVGGVFLLNYLQTLRWWTTDPEARDSVGSIRAKRNKKQKDERAQGEGKEKRSFSSMLKTRIFLYLCLSALAVLVAGYTVVQSGQAFSEKTGMASSLVGAVFIALATSLPELSTTVSAVRMRKYRLAFSNILGTNIFTIAFIFLADIFYSKGPILNEVDDFSLFAAMLGIILTAIYLTGLIVRLKKTWFNLGFDSVLVVIGYVSGVVIMFTVLKS